MASSSFASRANGGLTSGDSQLRRNSSRQLCFRSSATASPDVKADDTAEARRRLARQFRKHKLQPQPATVAPSLARSSYTNQLVRPRNRLQQQSLLYGALEQEQQWQQLPPAGAYIGQLHPADAAAAAAARELLEWQFQLEPETGLGANTATAAGEDAQGLAEAADPADADRLLLPSTLLPGLGEATADMDGGKQLTKAIMRASHWRQVQSLIQEHAPEMVNARHLCAALTRMVYLQPTFHSSSKHDAAQPQQQQQTGAGLFLQQLYSSIHSELPVLQYRQTCNTLWSIGKLKHTAMPSAECLEALYQHARLSCAAEQKQLEQQQQSEDASAQAREQHLQWRAAAFSHAGQVAASLVSLRNAMPAQQLQEMTSWLTSTTRDLLQDHIQQYQPLQEARAASKLQQQQQQQQRMLSTKPCQRPLPARDLANLAASLASLGVQPSPAWLSAFAVALGCKGLVYVRSYRDLSQLLWATAMFSKGAAEGSAAANSVQAAAAALMSTAQNLPLVSCDGQALANTLWSLATLGQRPPVDWLNRVLQHAEAAAARGFLGAQGVSMTLWALAALAVVPQASCLSALLAAAQQHFRHLTPQGFSNILWALAVLERPPSKDWLAGFWPACRTLLPQMTSQGLVNCMWAAARLGLQPPQEWVGDVAGLLLLRGVNSLTKQGLSNLVWALSKISITCRVAQELLRCCLQQALLVLQQQLLEQQSNAAIAAAAEAAAAAVASSSDADSSTGNVGSDVVPSSSGFDIFQLSGLLHAVCCLRLRDAAHTQQPQQHMQHMDSPATASSSSSSSSSALSSLSDAAAEGTLLLDQLTVLVQEVSTPLLPSATVTELSIMLWSQVAMPASTSTTTSSSSSGSTTQSVSLQIPRTWMGAWFAATRSSFSAASSRDLAFWMWCLAKARVYKPYEDWLASWQVASYRQLGRASSQDLSNMLWALASLNITPEPAWLQQHMQQVHRRQLQKSMEPQHYGNIGWALAKMGHRPERFWAERYQEDVVSLMPRFKPQELANVLWAMAVLNMKLPQELLGEVKGHMSTFLPAYKVNEVAVSLWALARLKGQPGLRLMAAALQHCFSQARQLTPKGLSMLMWSVGNLETPPPNTWVAKLLVATQVRMPGFSAQELSMLAVSLARLEYRPADTWLDTFAAAAAARMHSFQAQTLANTLWALATLHYTPSEAWMLAFDAQLSKHVNSCTSAHIAMILWALSRLKWLPAEPLLQQLQERAEIHSGDYILSSRRMLARAKRVLQKVESEDEEELVAL